MYCPKCGKMIKDGAAFCIYCGCRVSDAGKTENESGIENTYIRRNLHVEYFAAVAAGVVILIVSLALILPELRDRKKDNGYSEKAYVSESDFKDKGEEKADVSEPVYKDSEEEKEDEEKPNPASSASSRFSFDNGYKKGDIITFGEYEQDGDTSNGPEPIEWEILDNGSDGMLVISRYILDAKPYNEEQADVTWETCTLRKWLNDDFYNDAFSSDERNRIKETLVVNDYGGEGIGGNDTYDRIFLLSVDELQLYYDYDDEKDNYENRERLITEGTKYALDNNLFTVTVTKEDYNDYFKEQGCSTDCIGIKSGWWWLRSPGRRSNYNFPVIYVRNHVHDNEYIDVVDTGIGVRPVLKLEYSDKVALNNQTFLHSEYEKDSFNVKPDNNESKMYYSDYEKYVDSVANPVVSKFSDSSNYGKGDIITFGEYEQDGDTSNGTESIEWEVLDNGSDGILIISRYLLDAKPYNEESIGVTWETCTLRKWLNDDFYNEAFSPDEKSRIKETLVVNENKDKHAKVGSDTLDNVFLLSVDELIKFYNIKKEDAENSYEYCEKLITKGTKLALNNGLYTLTISKDDYAETLKGCGFSQSCVGFESGWWWLRSPGLSSHYASRVDNFGKTDAGYPSHTVTFCHYGVRPALYLEK